MKIPSEEECLELMAEVELAPAVIHHSIIVKKAALEFADLIEQKGTKVNRPLITAAALLHDIKKLDAEMCHGIEGGEFLRKKGFPEVASIVEKHCLINLDDPDLTPKTTEEKLLMYADLRVNTGKIVPLNDRFDYIKRQYRPKDMKKLQEFLTFAKQIEWELLGKDE
jgi:putative nucleotidyltransferase with HDIG domain